MSTINGTPAADSLVSTNSGADTLIGLDGDDTLDGGLGSNLLVGGKGNDTYVLNSTQDVVSELTSQGNDTIKASFAIDLRLGKYAQVENVVLGGLANLRADGADSDNLLVGNDGNNSLFGYAGQDTLNGLGGKDSLDGGVGHDVLSGGSGNDTLLGGAGDDTLTGGTDNDLLNGGSGNNSYLFALGDGQDTIAASTDTTANKYSILTLAADIQIATDALQRIGDSLVVTISDTDKITIQGFFAAGGSPIQRIKQLSTGEMWSVDFLQANGGGLRLAADTFADSTLTGSAYNDTLSGAYGNDTLRGGLGNDLMDGSYGDDYLDGGAGNDTMDGSYGKDYLDGGAGNDSMTASFDGDTLVGGSGNDTLYDGFGDDVLQGGTGDDYFISDTGLDTLDGGAGNDFMSIQNFDGATVLFGKGDGQDTIAFGPYAVTNTIKFKAGVAVSDVTARLIQSDLLLSVGANDSILIKDFNYVDGDGMAGTLQLAVSFTGSSKVLDTAALSAMSQPNVKTLNGTAGKDTLTGGATDDILNGGAGNDSLVGNAGYDTLNGGAGVDTMVGGLGNDVYVVDSLSDVINEVAGQGIDTVVVNNLAYTLNTTKLAAVENISATTSVAATYAGNTAANQITVAGSGATKLEGLAGNDTLQGGAGNDTLDGGTGNNTYVFGRGSGQDVILASTDTTAGKYNVLRIAGSDISYGDVLFAQQGQDLMVSLQGSADTVTVRNFFVGNDPANAVNPVQAFELPYGTYSALDVQDLVLQGNDLLTGTSGNELLKGRAGNDTLQGLAGNDTLDGGTGADVLNGGIGNNTYLFGVGDGQDTIESGADSTATRLNQLVFKSDIAASDVKLRHKGNDLVASLSANDGVTIRDFFANGGPANAANPVQQIVFTAGGTVLSASQLAALALAHNPDLIGTSGNDTLNGDYEDDAIYGLGGNDVLSGGGGNDTLDGGAGNDTLSGGVLMTGGEGDDTYIYSGGTIVEGPNQGRDTIYVAITDNYPARSGFSLNTAEFANIENLIGSGVNTPFGSPAYSLTGNAQDNHIFASDALSGGNTLYGLDGNDTLEGSYRGGDTFVGGVGNDTYVFGRGDRDYIIVEDANAGIDTVDCSNSYSRAIGLDRADLLNVENLKLGYAQGTINGNALDNTFTIGFLAGGRVDGGEGADTYSIYDGAGTVVFDNAGDRVSSARYANQDATQGGNLIESSVNVDLTQQVGVFKATLTGQGSLNVKGSNVADILTGNDGSNELNGRHGNDTLAGGLGSDTYAFAVGDGLDLINDAGGDLDTLALTGYTISQLGFVQDGLDLVVELGGSRTDQIKVAGWFDGTAHQIEKFAANGLSISNQDVNALVQALAAFAPPAAAGTAVTAASPQATLTLLTPA
jgi:Ca2+-binding RTX toxin-like protein